ncbi:MAG TPA: redoxin domain-containing protein [Tepidisphaeraceae bacterium]|jgi:thiol-disulfide isomerase/thioredoxin
MPRSLVSSLVIALSLFAATICAAEDYKTLEIGAAAPDFKLKGVDDKTYTLGDFAAAKILVIVFTCNHCPTAQAYEDRIIQLANDYKDKGVALVAINPNSISGLRLDELGYTDLTDDFAGMKIRAKDKNFPFPYLDDGETQSTAKAYGVVATPHIFIFDQERKLRYVGRIDDGEVKPPHSHDARNAIEAMLAGKPVTVEKTKVFGCSTKWASKNDSAKAAVAKWDAEPVSLSAIDLAGVRKLAANGEGNKLRLVNVWATWCGPCVIELPELVEMNRMYRHRRFEMVTISMDEPAKKDLALAKLKELKVATTNYILTAPDRDKFVETLDPKWEGPVPHTMLIAPGGKVIYQHTGEIDPLELKKAIVGYIGRTYASDK